MNENFAQIWKQNMFNLVKQNISLPCLRWTTDSCKLMFIIRNNDYNNSSSWKFCKTSICTQFKSNLKRWFQNWLFNGQSAQFFCISCTCYVKIGQGLQSIKLIQKLICCEDISFQVTNIIRLILRRWQTR